MVTAAAWPPSCIQRSGPLSSSAHEDSGQSPRSGVAYLPSPQEKHSKANSSAKVPPMGSEGGRTLLVMIRRMGARIPTATPPPVPWDLGHRQPFFQSDHTDARAPRSATTKPRRMRFTRQIPILRLFWIPWPHVARASRLPRWLDCSRGPFEGISLRWLLDGHETRVSVRAGGAAVSVGRRY